MDSHGAWRLAFAQALSTQLQQVAGIETIAVLGSVARGYSDQYSDLELLLVWKELPSSEEQSALLHSVKAEHRYPPFDPGYASAFRIQGFPVDLWHTTRAQEEATIHAVLHDHSLDLVANNRLDTILSCIPLYGADQVDDWKTRIRIYPDELARGFIETFIPHFHLRQFNLAAYRGNLTSFYHLLSDIQCSVFIVLLALNRSYFPTFKWMYPTLRRLSTTPPELDVRFQSMFSEPPIEAAAHLRTVLSETLDIVEKTDPHIDTAYARYGLEQEPQAYTRPFM